MFDFNYDFCDIVLVLTFILIVLTICWIIWLSLVRPDDITYDFKANGSVTVRNDLMRSVYSIKSKPLKTSAEAYKSVMHVSNNIKKLLEANLRKSDPKNDNSHNHSHNYSHNYSHNLGVSDLSLKTNVTPEYVYKDGERKLDGYAATVTVKYNYDLERGEKGQGSKEATLIQNTIIGMSSSDQIVTLDSVQYSVSDDQMEKFKSMALKEAIQNGKNKANELIQNTYPGSEYRIISINVTNDNGHGLSKNFYAAEQIRSMDAPNIVYQGDSTIDVSIHMTINVI